MLNLLVRKENHGIEPHGDKGRRKEADAYFTVEAAVIVPIVLFLFKKEQPTEAVRGRFIIRPEINCLCSPALMDQLPQEG